MSPILRAEPPADEAPTRQRRKEARPQELLDAALALFVEKGFAATRAEEVAQRAGVSKGTLYLYYPSKEELFKAVVRQNLGGLIQTAQTAAQQHQGSSSEFLAALVQQWWREVGSGPASGIPKIIFSEVRNFPELAQFYADEVIGPAQTLICSVVRRGMESGEFRTLPVEATAQALIAPVVFLALHQHSVGACAVKGCAWIEPQAMLNLHLDLVLNGLRTTPAADAATKPGASGADASAPASRKAAR